MKKTDKFLTGIVGGVILLVVISFTIAIFRPEPSYLIDDTAKGVAHNYLLSLRQKDYDRAYSYLSPGLTNYPPSLEDFIDDIESYSWNFRLKDTTRTLEIDSTRIQGDRAWITVREIQFDQNGLFDSSQQARTFEMRLEQIEGEWKIIYSQYYWARCWDDTRQCP